MFGQYDEMSGDIPAAVDGPSDELPQVPTIVTASVTIPAGIPAVPVEITGTSATEVFVHPGLGATNDCGLTLCNAACCAFAHDCHVARDEPATGMAGTNDVVAVVEEADAMPACGTNVIPNASRDTSTTLFGPSQLCHIFIFAAHFPSNLSASLRGSTVSPITEWSSKN